MKCIQSIDSVDSWVHMDSEMLTKNLKTQLTFPSPLSLLAGSFNVKSMRIPRTNPGMAAIQNTHLHPLPSISACVIKLPNANAML